MDKEKGHPLGDPFLFPLELPLSGDSILRYSSRTIVLFTIYQLCPLMSMLSRPTSLPGSRISSDRVRRGTGGFGQQGWSSALGKRLKLRKLSRPGYLAERLFGTLRKQ